MREVLRVEYGCPGALRGNEYQYIPERNLPLRLPVDRVENVFRKDQDYIDQDEVLNQRFDRIRRFAKFTCHRDPQLL